jgi:membrane carboxypeptidase/penicillin-binding protein
MHVRRLLEDELGLSTLEQGGLQVYTTLDLDMQDTARWIVRRRLAQLSEHQGGLPDRNVHNAALVALDPWTGEILAMLGSPDYFNPRIDGAVNVTLATRQPGSSIKPITYAAAFDPRRADAYTPATMISDVRTSFVTKEGDPYVPVNYDHLYRGPVLLRQALASSFNLVAVKVLDHVGLEDMTALARRLGITTLDDSERFGLALTLGGGEVRLLELTAAYAAFANGGHKVEPVAILRVEDSSDFRSLPDFGSLNREWRPETGERALDERVAYLVTDILSDDTARIAGFGEGSVLKLSRPAAAKTGTTTDWRDNWTIGYTPELVVGVWAGNADNEAMRHVSGVAGAAPIWHDFMEEVLKGRPVQGFVEPEGLVRVKVCASSGKLPSPHCPHRKTELFIAGTEPREYCTMHRPVRVDIVTGMLSTDACPPEQVVERVYTFLPTEAVEWGRKQGFPQPPLEYCSLHSRAENDAGDRMQDDHSPFPIPHSPFSIVMTSPDPNSIFRISPALPLGDQRIEIAARPAEETVIAELILYVDGEPLAELATPPYRSLWPLTPGMHAFHAEGYDATGRRLRSEPVYITVIE